MTSVHDNIAFSPTVFTISRLIKYASFAFGCVGRERSLEDKREGSKEVPQVSLSQ